MSAGVARIGLAAVMALAGCALTGTGATDDAAVQGAPAVALVLEGTAFDSAAARDEAAAVVTAVLGRTVRVLVPEPAAERVIGTRGALLGPPFARTAKTEAHAASCRKQRSVATAVEAHADTVLRIRLQARTTRRKASATERTDLAPRPGISGILSAVGLGAGDLLYETKLDGTLERTTFPGTPTSIRRPIRAADRRLGTTDDAPPASIRAALEGVLRALPPAPAARWEPLARGLVTAGCPVLAAAVGDAFAGGTAAKRRVRAAATAALAPPAAKPGEPAPVAAPVDPITPSPVEPAPLADAADAPPATEASDADAADSAMMCTNLCSLQMIELCNNDRSLWSQNGSRWEDTRCGLRRGESFLADCYRMQWLSGTYERACVQPCEESHQSRLRLVTMLRRSGCIRSAG